MHGDDNHYPGPADAALDPEEADQHQAGSRLPGHLRAENLSSEGEHKDFSS